MANKSAIQDLIHNNLTIPTLPDVVMRLTALIEDPESGAAEIGTMIGEDAPLATKVLRIANSAFYGLAAECVSTDQASTVLGVRVLRNIVTQVAVIDSFDHLKGNPEFDIEELWRHASRAAQVCAFLGKRSKTITDLTPDELYVCGLLHDVGKVVMLDSLGEAYVNAAIAARRGNMPLYVVEGRTFGFDHTDVGALVAGRWGLPQAIARAVQYHHAKVEQMGGDPVIEAIAKVDEMLLCAAEGRLPALDRVIDPAAALRLGLSPDDVAAVKDYAANATPVAM